MPPREARGEVLAPEGASPHVAVGTPLHELPVSKATRVLLPLYNKWVEAVLRDGSTVRGRLTNIRIRYIVIRTAGRRNVRIHRQKLVQVRLARRIRDQVTSETVAALKGRTVRLMMRDGKHLDGLVKSVSATAVNLETNTGVVEVPLRTLKRVLVAKPRPARPKSIAERLAGLVGRTVRIYRKDSTRVDGVLDKASPEQVVVKTSVGPVTVDVAEIARFLVGSWRSGASDAASPRPAARTEPPARTRRLRLGGVTTGERALLQRLLKKYARIKRNGARLRNWGVGLMVASAILAIVAGGIAGATDSDKALSFAYAMSGLSGAMFTPGFVMMVWGQVRHIRAIEWEHRLEMWRFERRRP